MKKWDDGGAGSKPGYAVSKKVNWASRDRLGRRLRVKESVWGQVRFKGEPNRFEGVGPFFFHFYFLHSLSSHNSPSNPIFLCSLTGWIFQWGFRRVHISRHETQLTAQWPAVTDGGASPKIYKTTPFQKLNSFLRYSPLPIPFLHSKVSKTKPIILDLDIKIRKYTSFSFDFRFGFGSIWWLRVWNLFKFALPWLMGSVLVPVWFVDGVAGSWSIGLWLWFLGYGIGESRFWNYGIVRFLKQFCRLMVMLLLVLAGKLSFCRLGFGGWGLFDCSWGYEILLEKLEFVCTLLMLGFLWISGPPLCVSAGLVL